MISLYPGACATARAWARPLAGETARAGPARASPTTASADRATPSFLRAMGRPDCTGLGQFGKHVLTTVRAWFTVRPHVRRSARPKAWPFPRRGRLPRVWGGVARPGSRGAASRRVSQHEWGHRLRE